MASVVGSTTINGSPAYLMSDGSKVIQQNSTPANSNRSTVYGTQSNTNSRPAANLGGGSVLGASTGGGGGGNPQAPSAPTAPSAYDQESGYIDEAFNSTMSYLNDTANKIRGQLPGIEQGINEQAAQSTNVLNQDYAQGTRQLDTAQQGGEVRKEDAITSARRLFNELQMGGQQRFGGASSAGEAYGALAGRELQRNNQQINTDFSTFMGQVEGARTTIEEKYTLAKQNLEVEKNRLLADARRSLDQQLMQIDQQKAMANEEKANRKLQALQGMRNQIYQIQLATAQGTADIDKIKQGLESELATYAQSQGGALTQAQGAGTQFSADTTTNPATGLAMNFGQDQAYQAPTGSVRKDENPVGAIYDPRRQYDQTFA